MSSVHLLEGDAEESVRSLSRRAVMRRVAAAGVAAVGLLPPGSGLDG